MTTITTTKKKTGRKQIHHVNTITGKTVEGLSKMRDGRWRLIGTQIRFSEPDEFRAIEKFLRLKGDEPVRNAIGLLTTPASRYGPAVAKAWADVVDGHKCHPDYTDRFAMVDPDDFWARVTKEILERPQWVAQKTGIEQIGYLLDLKKPEALPTLDSLAETWNTYAKCSGVQRRKVSKAWQDFVDTTAIADLRSITAEVVVKYQDDVFARTISGKYQAHIFAGIRRLLSFARTRYRRQAGASRQFRSGRKIVIGSTHSELPFRTPNRQLSDDHRIVFVPASGKSPTGKLTLFSALNITKVLDRLLGQFAPIIGAAH